MAIRFPHNAQHCTGWEAGHTPGPVLRPWRGAQALRLAGERIATPACALVRNDRLGGAVGLIESARVPAGAREGHDPPGQLQICLAAPSQRTRPRTRHCEERSDVAIRPPAMRTHCTGREAGHTPGPVWRPCRGAAALRLAGERIATTPAGSRNDKGGACAV